MRVLWLGLGLLLQGCEAATDVDPMVEPPLLQQLPRTLSSDELSAIRANNTFAFKLLGTVVESEGNANVFVSPLSVSLAVGMVMNGARGETRDSMAQTLGFGTLPQAAINASYRDLIALLQGLDDRVQFTIANSIWTERTFPVAPSFLSEARSFFDAEARALDFRSGDAVRTINGWVNDKTSGKIPTILESISGDEILFAVNAIYFKGAWRAQFRPADTRPATFHAQGGRQQTVPFMHRETKTPYYAGPDFQAVDLWYGAGAHTLTVLLPNEGTTADQLAARLTSAEFQEITQRLAIIDVALTFPKLRLEYKRSLQDDLSALGMGIAFSRRADLSGISTAADLRITRVDHKTFVEINEEGTEAAAATSVGVGVVSVPQRATVNVDRPFLFAIRERLSGTVLFLGRITSIPGAS